MKNELEAKKKETMEKELEIKRMELNITNNKKLKAEVVSKPEPEITIMEAMLKYLNTIELPTTKSAYELPKLILPDDNPNKNNVIQCDIVEDLNHRGYPDFLLTCTKQRIVNLDQFHLDPYTGTNRLSRVYKNVEINLGSGAALHALIAAPCLNKLQLTLVFSSLQRYTQVRQG
jgi:hypothetical protein